MPDFRIPRSFDAFYVEEFPRMVNIAYALSGSRLAAEDLAQDAMVAAHRQWDRVGTMDRPGAWTRRVVINKAASHHQRRRAELKALARLGPLRGTPPAQLDAESEHVWSEVRRLPKRQAQAVALFYLDDLSIRDIAEVMDCAESTVKVHLHQARRSLAERLQTEGEDR
ncbi:MAG: sigma-70 family RNA polymerase sigma factor [Acidimicrobiia bacterium]